MNKSKRESEKENQQIDTVAFRTKVQGEDRRRKATRTRSKRADEVSGATIKEIRWCSRRTTQEVDKTASGGRVYRIGWKETTWTGNR